MKLAWDAASRVDKHDGDYHREASASLYHTPRWTKLSRRFRDAHPLCAECLRQGKVTPSQCVDHIVPYPHCADFFDESNLQALCNRCNMEKGIKDRDKYRKAGGRG